MYTVTLDFRKGASWSHTLRATDEAHAIAMAKALAPQYGFDQPVVRAKAAKASAA